MGARRGVVTLWARGVIGGLPRALRGLRACVATAGLVAVVAGAVAVSPVAAQDNGGSRDVEVRIVARKLESGRVEFGLQQRQTDNSWGDRRLPRVRFFPTSAGVGRWLASSSLDLPAGEVRIVARRLESGRIEFGLQQRQTDNSWGDRRLPRVRFFPTTATVGRWLASSPLTLRTSPPAGRDPTPTDSGQTASRPADRDTTPSDSDQAAPRPADRDTTATGGDQYAQFEGDTVEVANPHSWWQRPRGDLVVHVHLCVEQGNEHLAKREVIDAYARALNEIHAPFYAWQSSGLLNVSFTAGEIKIANDVPSRWTVGTLPRSCDVSLRSCTTRAHCAGAIILAGNPHTTTSGGWGAVQGPTGVTFVTDAANVTVADIKSSPRHLLVTRHEFDHNVGTRHINGAARGPTRFIFPSLEQWEAQYGDGGDARGRLGAQLVGTLTGFPAALQQQEGFTVFPCYFLEAQGWPVGPNAPACARPGPPPVQDLRVDWLADGRPRVTWQPPYTDINTEPVTGYTVSVLTATRTGDGSYSDWNPSGTFNLPANTRSFVLPPSPSGEYQVGELFRLVVVPRSAVGFGESDATRAAVGFRLTEIRIEEVDTGCVESIEDCGLRTFEMSWPSNDLVERWLVVGMEGTSWNPITGSDGAIGTNNTFYMITEGFNIIRDKTYNFTVFGCLKDPPPSRGAISHGCFTYATATFTPRDPSEGVRLTDTGHWFAQCQTCPPQDRVYERVYQVEWTHIPGTTVYQVFAKSCIDAARPCRFDGGYAFNVEPDSSGTVKTQLLLLPGRRYEIDIHACGPGVDETQLWTCPVPHRTEVTVPPFDG